MKKLLVVYSSLNGLDGNSSKLARQFVNQFNHNLDCEIETLNLIDENLPHLTSEEMQAWMVEPEQRTEHQAALAAVSDAYIEQVKKADVIVIASPMYNFGIPSILKAWFDRVARAGVTFRYTENGPVGLLGDKKVYVASARGGIYQGTENDVQTPYLSKFLGFIGIDDVEFIYAEGLNMGEEAAKSGWDESSKKIIELIEK
ncbi:FMN-dependent NADH-azoreductase [Alteromonas sp. a30]|uniref:FMN-dependent NADH-azoreductase n=1 Tax=Alteromonas sp. a30 TaxID=2730917 RepID=UPI00227F9B7B|nr:NAD(P)H-dependent oxidoreductase [Alteromonas sp. a30]MCY7297325.1 FMN-dependent NADH-azoreductase [Alteromonas sp. a30]